MRTTGTKNKKHLYCVSLVIGWAAMIAFPFPVYGQEAAPAPVPAKDKSETKPAAAAPPKEATVPKPNAAPAADAIAVSASLFYRNVDPKLLCSRFSPSCIMCSS